MDLLDFDEHAVQQSTNASDKALLLPGQPDAQSHASEKRDVPRSPQRFAAAGSLRRICSTAFWVVRAWDPREATSAAFRNQSTHTWDRWEAVLVLW